MKRVKQIHKKQDKLTPEQALKFLDDFSQIAQGKDTKTQLISIRVPENILNSFKLLCKEQNMKYQSQIIRIMREWVIQKK